MNGCAIPYSPIAVDFLKTRQCPRVKCFFLTHAFVDQTCGLSHSWSLPVYCSPLTRKILLSKFSIRPDVVRGLELNVRHSISLCDDGNKDNDDNDDDSIKVTLIDSNHCPGSVMFFFEGYFGRILYTGNFRLNEPTLQRSPLPDLVKTPVDVLYLDNTYCNPKCLFPTKESALDAMREVVLKHIKGKVLIALETFGKEEMLLQLARHFQEKIKVNEERMRVLEVLNEDKNFTSNNLASSSIDVVPLSDIFRKADYDVALAEPSVCIVPTGLFTALGYNPFESQSNIFVVPYSSHSSYAELMKFVAFVRPKSIVPMNKPVNDPVSGAVMERSSVDCFQELLDRSPMRHYHIPPSVMKVMNQSTTARGKRSSKASAKKTRKQSAPMFPCGLDRAAALENARRSNDVGRRASSYVGPSTFDGNLLQAFPRPHPPPPLRLPPSPAAAAVATSTCNAHPTRRISLPTPQPELKVLKKWKSVGSFAPVREQASVLACQSGNIVDLTIPRPTADGINCCRPSNLVRSHRARLCTPGKCQTTCDPRNVGDCCSALPPDARRRESEVKTDFRHRRGLNPTAFEHNDRRKFSLDQSNLMLADEMRTRIDYNVRLLHRTSASGERPVSSSSSEANFRGEEAGASPRLNSTKRAEDKVDESFSTSDLPPKKKWCNKFNTSQKAKENFDENKDKTPPPPPPPPPSLPPVPVPVPPPPRRRMGTTANPVEVHLNSTTYTTSNSNYALLLTGFQPKIFSSTRSPSVQRNCGHSMKFIFPGCHSAANSPVNLCSPIDLSMSKD